MRILRTLLFPIVGFIAGWAFAAADASHDPAKSPRPGTSPAPPHASVAPSTSAPPVAADGSSQPAPPRHAVAAVPLVSLREMLAYSSDLHRIAAFERLLSTLTPAQFPALRAELARLLKPEDDYPLINLFYRRWAQLAPEAAVEASVADHHNGLRAAITAWAELDPLKALARLKDQNFFTAQMLREEVAAMGLPKPGQFPPAEAMRQIRERLDVVGPSTDLGNAAVPILFEWAKSDPTAAWQAAAALPGDDEDGGMRRFAMFNVIAACTQQDLKSVSSWIDALPTDSERSVAQAAYVESLTYGAHESMAREYALALPDGPNRRAILAALAGAMVNRERWSHSPGPAETAGAFLTGLPAGDWQDPTLFADVIQPWMSTQPQQASEALLAHLPPADQLTDKDATAYARMTSSWATKDPGAAGEFLIKLPDAIRGPALTEVLKNWCYQDAAAAGQWAAALPAGPIRDQALEQTAVAWTSRGAGEVTKWLDSLPADSGRDAAVEGFARTVMSVTPDDALAWLRTVPNEADRLARLRRAWQSWADREAAQRWLARSADLTAAERAALNH